MTPRFPLKIVDALAFPAVHRTLFRPDEALTDAMGATHFLPRFFYEVESWAQARHTRFTEHFSIAELMVVDCRERYMVLRSRPHFVPCAALIFCGYLEEFRRRVDAPVFIAINGGYRSPAHGLSRFASPHLWGTAANIYRVGDTFLDNQKEIEKYARIAESIGPEVFAKPFGHGDGETDDHLHLDVGYLSFVPRGCDEARNLKSGMQRKSESLNDANG
jgi:hypothetical protein